MRLAKLPGMCLAVLVLSTSAYAQRGKVGGTVTDAASGETLPGVNVYIEELQQGGTTDADGFYFINNVRPGTYTVCASFIGFLHDIVSGRACFDRPDYDY